MTSTIWELLAGAQFGVQPKPGAVVPPPQVAPFILPGTAPAPPPPIPPPAGAQMLPPPQLPTSGVTDAVGGALGTLGNALRGLGPMIGEAARTVQPHLVSPMQPLLSPLRTMQDIAQHIPAEWPSWLTSGLLPRDIGAMAPGEPPEPPVQQPLQPVSPSGGAPTRQGAGGPQTFTLPQAIRPDYRRMVDRAEGTGRNPRSTAAGYGQFLNSTFHDFLKDTNPEAARTFASLDAASKIAAKQAFMNGPGGERAMDWLERRNRRALAGKVPVDNVTMYGAHFLGPADLIKVWNAPPETPVSQLVSPASIQANPEILSGRTAGEVRQWLRQKMSLTPLPPQAAMPPSATAPAPQDFSRVREFYDKSLPSSGFHMGNVFGQMAAGAAAVDPTSPGSFARALAGAGAGASGGLAATGRAASDAFARRGSAEMGVMSAEHAQEKALHDVAYLNAVNRYNTQIANEKAMYEHRVGEFAAAQPKVERVPDGLMIRQMDPNTRQETIKIIPTKRITEKLENLSALMKAFGASHPLVEAAEVHVLGEEAKGSPELYTELLRENAARWVIKSGAGSQVFGDAYAKAAREARAELAGDVATLMGRPAEYLQELNARILARIKNTPEFANTKWLERAQNHSQSAKILMRGQGR